MVNPYWLSDWADVRAELSVQTNYSAFYPLAFFRFAAIPLRLALTWPVELAAFLGLSLILKERRDDKLILLALCFVLAHLPIYYSTAAYQERGMRYCMALIPLGGLLAAHLITRLKKSLDERAWAVLLAAIGFHLTLSAATASHNFAVAAGEDSTNRQAGRWLEENVPQGASIGLWALPRPANAPYFRLDRNSLSLLDYRDAETLPREKLPDFLVLFQPELFRRPQALAVLSAYEKVMAFERPFLVPWLRVHWSETLVNPVFEIYEKSQQDEPSIRR